VTKFFVGQRVRVVIAEQNKNLQGVETRIAGICENDVYETEFVGPIGMRMLGFGYQFEPIQYDGMQPVEWSECLWQPEGQHA
jgi:hypothetical protein